MMAFADIAVRFVVAVLFDGLWIAALLAVAAWIALRAMPNANATTRHSILAAALYAAIILPIAVAALTVRPHTGAGAISASTATAAHATAVSQRAETTPGKRPASATHLAAPATVRPAPSLPRPMLSLPRPVAIAIVAAWLLGAAFVLVRLLLSLHHLERLKQDALPVPIEYRAQLHRWSQATKGARGVRLCRSADIVVPIAVGLFDAMILVPERLLEELPPDDVDSIVLHELAHLRRGDDWINAVERVAQALLFFNPAIGWLIAQLDVEREVACDDWVLQQKKVLPYATCLARIVESVAWPYRAISAPGAFVTRRGMSVRIERLLASHRDVRVHTSIGPAGATIAALGALCLAATLVAPSIAYTAATPASHANAAPVHAAAPLRLHSMKASYAANKAAHPAAAARLVAAATAAPAKIASSGASAAQTKQRSAKAAHVESAHSQSTAASARTAAPLATPGTVASAIGSAMQVAASVADASASRSIVVAANSPDYIDSLASVGYTNLSVDDLVRLKAVGVTADYIRGIENAGLAHPSVEDLVRLRALGVTPAYLSSMADAGYPKLTIEQITQLRSLDIDAAYIAKAAAHGMHHLSVEQLVQLKATGVL